MTDDEIISRIMQLVEVEFWKRDLTKDAVAELQGEYDFLLKELSEGPKKEKLLEKLALKNRYNYLINDTGNINSTGYGGNFY
jgi:hypothetical protein